MDDGEKSLPAHGELATEPYWPLEIVLQWLKLRNYHLLAEVNSRDDGRTVAELNDSRAEGGLLAATIKRAFKDLGPGDLNPRATLLAALRRGAVKAHDYSSLKEPRAIKADEWGGGPHKGGLRIYFEDGRGAPYAALAPKGTRIERVLIDRASVISEFPELEGRQEIHTVASAPTTASQWTSAAAWYRECGKAEAEASIKKANEIITNGNMYRHAARIWNAMPGNEHGPVTSAAFKKALQREPKKSAGTQRGGAGAH